MPSRNRRKKFRLGYQSRLGRAGFQNSHEGRRGYSRYKQRIWRNYFNQF